MYFLDSSIIIETLKGNKTAILIWDKIKEKKKLILFINEVVYSETIYQLCIKKNFSLEKIYFLLKNSTYFLKINEIIIENSITYIKKFNLRPHDAFIISTCKFYEIPNIISLDKDFIKPCNMERIKLINSNKLIT